MPRHQTLSRDVFACILRNDVKRLISICEAEQKDDGFCSDDSGHAALSSQSDRKPATEATTFRKPLGWLDERDEFGNTPLMLACFLRRRQCVHILCEVGGASCNRKSLFHWSPLQECLAVRDVELAAFVYMRSISEIHDEYFSQRVPGLLEGLESLPDFYVEVNWRFHSYVPLVSRLAPHDTYRIWKRGSQLRVDATLIGFEGRSWKRGNVSILFIGRDRPPPDCRTRKARKRARRKERERQRHENSLSSSVSTKSATPGTLLANGLRLGDLVIADHANKIIEKGVKSLAEADEREVARDLTELVRRGLVVSLKLNVDNLIASPVKKSRGLVGLLTGAKQDPRVDTVAGFEATVYRLTGLRLDIQTRKTKYAEPAMKPEDIITRDLPPYYQRLAGEPPDDSSSVEPTNDEPGASTLDTGLMHAYEEFAQREKELSGKAWIVAENEFGHSIKSLLPVFHAIAPKLKHFQQLTKFLPLLPDGFPVKLEIPVVPTVSAVVSFLRFVEFDNEGKVIRTPGPYCENDIMTPDVFALPEYRSDKIIFEFDGQEIDQRQLDEAIRAAEGKQNESDD